MQVYFGCQVLVLLSNSLDFLFTLSLSCPPLLSCREAYGNRGQQNGWQANEAITKCTVVIFKTIDLSAVFSCDVFIKMPENVIMTLRRFV